MRTINEFSHTIGDTLTINHEIIDLNGNTIFKEGQIVTIRDIEWREGYYSRLSGEWVDKKPIFIKLVEKENVVYPLHVFKEFNKK